MLERLPSSSRSLQVVGELRAASPPGSRKFVSVKRSIEAVRERLAYGVPPVVYSEPHIEEPRIHPLTTGDAQIAVLKAHQVQEASRAREKRGQYSPDTPVIGYLQAQREGLRLEYANDVISWRRQPDGQGGEPEYKLPSTSTKADVLSHLTCSIGEKANPLGYLEVGWSASCALHEAFTDITVVRRETHTLWLLPASQDFLHALIYGLEDPDHPVAAMTRKQFMRLYTHGTEYSTPGYGEKPKRHEQNWSGWTPEAGMPLEQLLRVNGARPGDSLPFIELLVVQVDGLRPTQSGFAQAVKKAIQCVRGKVHHFPELVDQLVEVISRHATLADLENFAGDEEFITLAQRMKQARESGQIPSTYEFSGRATLVAEGQPIDIAMLTSFVSALLGLHDDGPRQ